MVLGDLARFHGGVSTDKEPAWTALQPLILEVGRKVPELPERIGDLREALFLELGIRFPPVVVREAGAGVRVLVDELQFANGGGDPVALLERTLRRHARRFLKVQTVQSMLDAVAQQHPALVGAVVPHVASLLMVTEVLGRLAEEEIPLRNLPLILQAIAEVATPGADGFKLTEAVRGLMKHEITRRYGQPPNHVVCLLLDPQIEELVERAIERGPEGTHLKLEPELAQEIAAAVAAELKPHAGKSRPVILTTAAIRRFVRKLLEYELDPPLRVMSYPELTPDVNVQPIGRVSLPSEKSPEK